jgi:methionyl-tRNA formyltransferase
MSTTMAAVTTALDVRSARWLLFAYQEVGYTCIEQLLKLGAPIVGLFTHQDSPGEGIWWRSCAELAAAHAIPTYTPEKIGEDECALVRNLAPAIIYSFYYRSLLPATVLRSAPLGAYNLHGSRLPIYRGRAPVNCMIINGETEVGVTLHHMVERADAGDIVAQRAVAIDDEDTALTLHRKIVPLGAELLREYHPQIVAGTAPRHPQDLKAGSYFGRRRPEDGRIDWHWPARRIFNLIRGVTHPYPGAFGFLNGQKLMVWKALIATEGGQCGPAGAIIGQGPDGAIEIAAGTGSLHLISVQFEKQPERLAAEALGRCQNSRLE